MRQPSEVRAAFAALLAIGLAITALAHGGHGKPESQFHVRPADPVSAPDTVVVKLGGLTATRADFVAYIDAVSAFQMRADLLQRNFLLRFWVAEVLSRYHPEDINKLMPPLASDQPLTGERKERIDRWIDAQADLYARLLFFADRAEHAGRADEPQTVAVLDCFAAHVKAEVLEDLVGYGPMEPTPDAVRAFAKSLSDADLAAILDKRDGATAREKRAAAIRWIAYRKAVIGELAVTRTIDDVLSPSQPQDTPIGSVGGRMFTLGELLAVFGPVPNDDAWEAIKRSRSAQLLRAYAMAGEADALGIVRARTRRKIGVGRLFYLAADQAVREYGPMVLGISNSPVDFETFRQIAYYRTLKMFEAVFHRMSRPQTAGLPLWIDREFLASIRWRVQVAYAPPQAMYF